MVRITSTSNSPTAAARRNKQRFASYYCCSLTKLVFGCTVALLVASLAFVYWFSANRAMAVHTALREMEDLQRNVFAQQQPTTQKKKKEPVVLNVNRRNDQQHLEAEKEAAANDKDDVIPSKFHIVFSTGCNAFQDWQSYAFFYQIYKSGQLGDVTRVASGCTEADAVTLQQVFVHQIKTLPTGDRFHLHLTPDYSKTAGIDFKFFNKPFGLLHWMEHAMDWPSTLDQYEDTIVVVMDPDQFLLRPFQVDYSNDDTAEWHKVARDRTEFIIKKGQPFGQYYGMGASWVREANKDIPKIVKAALNASQSTADPNDPSSSHLYQWTDWEVLQSYNAGPPYIAVASDLYQIVKMWAAVAVPVKELTDDHLSEMFAYSTGAAHAELPHTLAYSFMISSPANHDEGWGEIDAAAPEEVCQHVRSDIHTDPAAAAWAARVPQVLHYCQRYFLGPYFFSKYKLPNDFLSCDKPLLKDPLDHEGPIGFVTLYNSSVTPNNQLNLLQPRDVKRHAFSLCYIITIMNEALTYWKQHHCSAEDNPNFSKEFLFPFDKKKD